ncbi:DUF896 domain-containing protein [Clostridioides difficile]|uniref:DUF896 domain-containing protein n=1 Tax=Clostridioides difficile TaxID=1496 RepID=UPI0010347A02|nr:DUF896 domain-containing protein [Clostridioides difficile]
MFDKKKLDRINELAKKNKERNLSANKIKERQTLKKENLENFSANVKSRLDSVKVVSPEEYEQ